MEAAELELQEGITRAFILADAENLVLRRRTRTSDGAGGFKYATPVDLAVQVFRIIPQTDQVPEIQDSNGRMAMPEWVILGESGADMKQYDRFTWRGMDWEIVQIHQKPDYEKKGDVVRVGG
jgi:hypothetical protein